MASNEEILKQIALLSGALNQQRHGNGRSFHPYISARPGHNRTLINNRPIRNGAAGGRIPEQRPAQASTGVSSTYIPSRNRTLVVVNNGTPSPTPRTPEQTDISATLSSAPVSYVRKGNKLVRVGCAASPKQPRPRKSIRKAAATLVELDGKTYKKSSDGKRLIASGIRTPKPAKRTLNINGVTFSRSGNKLIRQPDSGQKVDNTGTPQTPKRVLFKGVPYVRSKKGNLVLRRLTSRDYCPKYRYGRCTRGQGCKFIHDPRRLAVCPGLIYKGACTRESCALSHAPDQYNMPVCVHFERGRCSKANCPYLHVKLDPEAPICRAFATEGFCEAGSRCRHRHAFICPDFAAGKCLNSKCRLPHKSVDARSKATSRTPKDDEELEALMQLPIRPDFSRPAPSTESDEDSDSENEGELESEGPTSESDNSSETSEGEEDSEEEDSEDYEANGDEEVIVIDSDDEDVIGQSGHASQNLSDDHALVEPDEEFVKQEVKQEDQLLY